MVTKSHAGYTLYSVAVGVAYVSVSCFGTLHNLRPAPVGYISPF